MTRPIKLAIAISLAMFPLPARAFHPDSAVPGLRGADLSLMWGARFVGVLLSIALVPLFAARFWHDHYGKVVFGWIAALLVPFTLRFGLGDQRWSRNLGLVFK